MYFDDSDFGDISHCTNVRYLQEKGKALNLTAEEVKKYPQIKMYSAKMTKVSGIAGSMTLDRYFQNKTNLKVVIDADVPENERKADKFFNIRPLIERIRKSCTSVPRNQVVAIDEQMWLKNVVCATPKGLVLDFVIYQVKNTFLDHSVTNLGVGPSAVVKLNATLLEGMHIYIDRYRYFTTIPLIEYMLNKNMVLIGTIMKSRVPKSIDLTSDKMMSRRAKSDEKINIVQWYDMKSVLLASSSLQIHTDRMMSHYRMGARSKKWTVKTIFHLFDLAIANSWILYRDD
nr:unnamed protein product [Callosobruchus analis]